MASGEKFQDIEEFKRIVLSNPDQIARNLVHHLMTFATGEPISFTDRHAVEDVIQQTREHEFGVRSLIHAVVDSPVFLSK